MTEHDDAPEFKAAVERAKQYEAMASRYVKKALVGEAGAAQMAQTFSSGAERAGPAGGAGPAVLTSAWGARSAPAGPHRGRRPATPAGRPRHG